jgi:DNA-binding NtrC family response regulator
MTASVRPRVLCVDDDANVLAALQRQLRGRYDVVLAVGAEAGLEHLRDSGEFAVVVSDLHMPGIDGRAFLTAARVIAPRTVAVLMTGSGNGDAASDPALAGLAFRHVDKPCLPTELWASIDAAVAHHALDGAEPAP